MTTEETGLNHTALFRGCWLAGAAARRGSELSLRSQEEALDWPTLTVPHQEGRKWQPTPVFLLGESLGQRRLVGYSPWCQKKIGHDLATKPPPPGGEHDNSLQYSWLENLIDRGAWWATIYDSQRVRHDWSNLACMHNPTSSCQRRERLSIWTLYTYHSDHFAIYTNTESWCTPEIKVILYVN